MSALQLRDLSYRHEAILDWLILNPNKSQGDCARELGYTEAWLSVVINSDLFQARLRMLQQEKREHGIFTIAEKLAGLADMAIERTIKHVEVSVDPAFVLSAAEVALKRLGYGAKAPVPTVPTTVNNTMIVATQDGLREAVGIMREVKRLTPEMLEHDDQDRSGLMGRVLDESPP
jgi:phosphate starvation-inducible protein PhoH